MHVNSPYSVLLPQTYEKLSERVEENLIDETNTWDSALLISSMYLSFVMIPELSPEIIIFPVDPGPAPSSGFNPLSRIYNIYTTTMTWLFQKKNVSYETISFPQAWQMFNSAIVHQYINHLNKEKANFKFIRNFLLIKPEINLCLLKNILLILESELESEIELPINQPICIPIVLAGKQNLSSNHIVALLIKDGMIEYFDSMGIPSDQIILGNNSETLRNVLEYLQAKLGFQIIEHEVKLQADVHNCGVFVCEFYRQRLASGVKMGSKMGALSDNELLSVREKIFSDIFPIMKAEAEINLKTDAESALYDEFDDIFDDLLKTNS